MANFEANAFLFSDINNGQRYQNGDIPDAEAINKPIEASKYAVDLSRLALATAEGNKEGGSVGEEYLRIFATKEEVENGSYPNMTAGKLGGRWSTENIAGGAIINPLQNGVYLCYISANGYLYTSIVFVTTYHSRSYGTAATSDNMYVCAYYMSDYNQIFAFARNIDDSQQYQADIIGYYRII